MSFDTDSATLVTINILRSDTTYLAFTEFWVTTPYQRFALKPLQEGNRVEFLLYHAVTSDQIDVQLYDSIHGTIVNSNSYKLLAHLTLYKLLPQSHYLTLIGVDREEHWTKMRTAQMEAQSKLILRQNGNNGC
jgi:hypothetical protein